MAVDSQYREETERNIGWALETSAEGRNAIREQLERLLKSSSFRSSRRASHFLSFVVDEALAGRQNEIKERLIGIRVFERPPDYELATDPIVRGAAAELRKRLAQYYVEPIHAAELRLDLPTGTYVPKFKWPDAVGSETQITPSTPVAMEVADSIDPRQAEIRPRATSARYIGLILAITAGFVALSGAFWYRTIHSNERTLNGFWAPLLTGDRTIGVCAGYLRNVDSDDRLHPDATAALFRIASMLGSKDKKSFLLFAQTTDLSELRQHPVIYIGAFNNQWATRIVENQRFHLVMHPGSPYITIADRNNPTKTSWTINNQTPSTTLEHDYALITRMTDPLTGQPVILISGLGTYGNAAASEFVTNPEYFVQFTRKAPKNWESRNIQLVIEATIVNGRGGVPRLVDQSLN